MGDASEVKLARGMRWCGERVKRGGGGQNGEGAKCGWEGQEGVHLAAMVCTTSYLL